MQTQTETVISDQRKQLDAWLADSYSRQPDLPKNGELEAGYPNWGEIETVVSRVFNQQSVRQLSAASVRSLLFFISRSDECGCIIAWLRPETDTPFSDIGNLTYDDFAFLCEEALSEPDDFCDYQLVTCFQKLAVLSDHDEDLLERFFYKKMDSYTRRMVIYAFAKFRYRKAIPLIKQLWSTDDCEFAKLSCLYSLEPFPEARDLLSRYLKEYQDRFPIADEEYRRTHVDRLMAIEGN
ncbi:hypothetical protein [uncultured Rubinisphaera sp.]|uniref:hypothetical protein n=1 Tax=uncultured Rubinisphaera sp. TaxID=1678686 RepID=UPI0030DB94D4|tara:strand:+ start:2237 stop:2950 length:714 start_codon:yes stop_codon:yes gene_type:complete